HARPDEVPEERLHLVLRARRERRANLELEYGAPRSEERGDRFGLRLVRNVSDRWNEERQALASVERDLAVLRPERSHADPGDLAARAELVEKTRVVVLHTRREDLLLEI